MTPDWYEPGAEFKAERIRIAATLLAGSLANDAFETEITGEALQGFIAKATELMKLGYQMPLHFEVQDSEAEFKRFLREACLLTDPSVANGRMYWNAAWRAKP